MKTINLNNMLASAFNPDSVSWTKFLLILFALLIIIIILFGLIYVLIRKTMDMQGKKVDNLMANVIISGVVNDKKLFKKLAVYKSTIYFVKKTWIPMLIMVICVICYFAYAIPTKDYSFVVKYTDEFFPKLERAPGDTEGFFGITWMPTKWPVWNFEKVNWTNFATPLEGFRHYLILFFWVGLLFGAGWYFFQVQGYVARYMRINEIIRKGFTKDLVSILQQANMQTPFNINVKPNID